jgi:hypothetical protein
VLHRLETQSSAEDPPEEQHQQPSSATAGTEVNPAGSEKNVQKSSGRYFYGYLLSFANVAFDTYGSLLTKQYGVNMTVWQINLLRFGFAGVVMLVISLTLAARDYCCQPRRDTGTQVNENTDTDNHAQPLGSQHELASIQAGTLVADYTSGTSNDSDALQAVDGKEPLHGETQEAQATYDGSLGGNHQIDKRPQQSRQCWYLLPIGIMSRSQWLHVSAGVFFVTFATPSMSNYALFQIALALALTFGSVGPLYAIPLSWLLSSKTSPAASIRTVVGSSIAVCGIAILAFWGTLPDGRIQHKLILATGPLFLAVA